MERIGKYPMLSFCAAFLLSVFILSEGDKGLRLSLLCLLALPTAAGIILLFCRHGTLRQQGKAVLLISLAVLSADLVQLLHKDRISARILALDGQEAEMTAVIEEIDLKEDFAAVYTAKVRTLDGRAASFRVKLILRGEFDAEIGRIVSLRAVMARPAKAENGFPLRRYYASLSILLTAEGEGSDCRVIGEHRSPTIFFRQLSERFAAGMRLRAGKEYGGLASGLLLGRREDVPDNVKRDFRFLGISHILAVSGLHLTVLAGGLLVLLRRLHLPRLLQLLLCTALILFMIFLTGFTLSVVRAGIMYFLSLLASFTGRAKDSLTALFAAGALIVFMSPDATADVGFLLSFSATLGLLTLGKRLSSAILSKATHKPRPIRALGKLLASASVTLSAMLFTLPFTFLYFGELSVVAPLSNLLFVPLSGIFLFASAGLLLFSVGPPAAFFGGLTGSLAALITDLAAFFARLVPEPISLRHDFTVTAFVFAGLSFVLLLFLKKRSVLFLLIPAVIWSGIYSGGLALYTRRTGDSVTILSVNLMKNDYLLIRQHGRTLLCDFSDGRYTRSKSVASLTSSELYDASVDVLLLTHLHRYHVSTFCKLADNNRLSGLILPEPTDDATAEAASALSEEASERGIRLLFYSPTRESTVVFRSCRITLMPQTMLSRSVQPILCLSVDTGHGIFGYFGSSVFESELCGKATALASRSDVVWYGIHGPNIKKPLPSIPVSGEVLVSSPQVNEDYRCAFEPIGSDGLFFRRFVFE